MVTAWIPALALGAAWLLSLGAGDAGGQSAEDSVAVARAVGVRLALERGPRTGIVMPLFRADQPAEHWPEPSLADSTAHRSVGRALAEASGWPYHEAPRLRSDAEIARWLAPLRAYVRVASVARLRFADEGAEVMLHQSDLHGDPGTYQRWRYRLRHTPEGWVVLSVELESIVGE